MQGKPPRRSNKDRTESTRLALITAARALFVQKGYAETGTPEIVAAANVTRGALYHHFTDKADLFRAVVHREGEAVAAQIGRDTTNPTSALDALMAGSEAYFAAMAVPGRARLLLLDGPSVLGHQEMDRIDRATGGGELRQGLAYAMSTGALRNAPLDALTEMLSAAFDRAALAIAEGKPPEGYKDAVALIVRGLLDKK